MVGSGSSPEGRTTAWLLVAVQFVLLGLLVFGPSGSLWSAGAGVRGLALALEALGLVVMIGAAWQIRWALTASPLPNARTELVDRGWFGRVRHPIYTGLLLFAAGLTLARASVLAMGSFAALVVLLQVKARFEEAALARRFPGYEAYMARTGRLIPKLPRNSEPEPPLR